MSEETETDERTEGLIVRSGDSPKPVVFLDATFLIAVSHKDPRLLKLLEYSQQGSIRLCASLVAVEEWRTRKVDELWSAIERSRKIIEDVWRCNMLAEKIERPLSQHDHLDRDVVKKESFACIKAYLEKAQLEILPSKEEHIQKTWGAYFNGGAPFKGEKISNDPSQSRRKDIPDAWIYQAALDAKKKYGPSCDYVILSETNSKNAPQGKDGNLSKHLNDAGYRSLDINDLLKEIENALARPQGYAGEERSSREENGVVPSVEVVPNSETALRGPLEQILSSGRTNEIQKIYLRVLGYTHWLDGPGKQGLIKMLLDRGHTPDLIEASIAMLKADPLAPIKDTGNHILPNDKAICQQAADRTKDEVLWLLEQESLNG